MKSQLISGDEEEQLHRAETWELPVVSISFWCAVWSHPFESYHNSILKIPLKVKRGNLAFTKTALPVMVVWVFCPSIPPSAYSWYLQSSAM